MPRTSSCKIHFCRDGHEGARRPLLRFKKKKPVLLACFEHHHLIDLCACVCVCMCAELLAAYKLGLHYVLRDVFLSRRFASFIFLFLNCRCLSKKVEKTNSSSKDLRFFFFLTTNGISGLNSRSNCIAASYFLSHWCCFVRVLAELCMCACVVLTQVLCAEGLHVSSLPPFRLLRGG